MQQLKNTLLIFGCLALSACASQTEPTKGDVITAQGAEFARIGEQWNKAEGMIADGNALIKDGEKEIKKGKKLVSSGEDKVKKGQKMVKKGNVTKLEAEEAYELKKM